MCCANLSPASISYRLIPGFLIGDVVLGLWSSQRPQAQASRCLLQLCLIQTPTAIQRQQVYWCFLRCAQFPEKRGSAKRFDTLWEISALYPRELSTASLPELVRVKLRFVLFCFCCGREQSCKQRSHSSAIYNMKKITFDLKNKTKTFWGGLICAVKM